MGFIEGSTNVNINNSTCNEFSGGQFIVNPVYSTPPTASVPTPTAVAPLVRTYASTLSSRTNSPPQPAPSPPVSTQAWTPAPALTPAPPASTPLSGSQLVPRQSSSTSPLAVPQANGSNGFFSPQNLSQIGDASLSVISTTMQILSDAAHFTGVPYLSEAAALARTIFETIQLAKGNKDDFNRLANYACRLVSCIYEMVQDCLREGKHLPLDLNSNLDELVKILTDIKGLAEKRASQSFWERCFRAKSDAGKVQEYRGELDQCLNVFFVQSHTHVRQDMEQILQALRK